MLAMHDYNPTSPSQNGVAATCLSFQAGQIIRLYNRDGSGWWDGEVDGRRGWFPSNYVTADTEAFGMLQDEVLPVCLGTRLLYILTDRGSRQGSRMANGHVSSPSATSTTSWASSVSLPRPHTRTDHRPIESTSSTGSTVSASSIPPISGTYCPPLMVPLLHALNLLSTTIKEQRTAHLQPATACIISCVRSILTEVGCLQKDVEVLKRYAPLAKERKRILGDLGGLVERAKAAAGEVAGHDVRDMTRLGNQLFGHVRTFLAIAVQCGIDVRSPSYARGREQSDPGRGSIEGRWDSQEGTLVRSDGEPDVKEVRGEWKVNEHQPHTHQQDVTSTPKAHMRAKSLSDLKARASKKGDESEEVPAMPKIHDKSYMHSVGRAAGQQWKVSTGITKRFTSAPVAHAHVHSAQSSVSSVASATSSASSSSGSSTSSASTPPTPFSSFPTGPTTTPALLQALRSTHDTYLSTIAAFIGHAHSHSRSSHASSTGHMYDLVREVVEVVCRLLTIVDGVLRADGVQEGRKGELRRAKEGLYAVTSTLADAVRKLTTTPSDDVNGETGPRGGEDELSEEEEKAALLRCATNALKAGADCVGAVKKCLQRASGERPLIVMLPAPGQEPDADGEAAYATYTPSKFSHQRQESQRSYIRVTDLAEAEEGESGHVRSTTALQVLYRASGIQNGEVDDEDLTIQAQTVSFRSIETPRKAVNSGPSVPEVDEPENDLRTDRESAGAGSDDATIEAEGPIEHVEPPSDTETEDESGHGRWAMSPTDSLKDKPLPPLQIPTPTSAGPEHQRSSSPVSSLAPTDDGTTWEGGHNSQLPPASEKARSELPPVPNGMPVSQSRPEGLSWLLSHDHSDEVAYNGEGQLVGASLRALVERMTPHDALVEPAFAAVFFMTFRLFTTPQVLVGAIIARYNILPPPGLTDGETFLWQQQKGLPVRLRVGNFLKSWLETYWRPRNDNVVLPELAAFTRDALATMFPVPSQRIMDLIQSKGDITGGNLDVSPKADRTRDAGIPLNPPSIPPPSGGEVPRPIMTKTVLSALRTKNYTSIAVTDFDPLELARQLTTMECTLYCAIPSAEILETGESHVPYPAVKAVTSLSTVITGWVAESILNEPDAKRRTTLVKFFIKVADVGSFRCLCVVNYAERYCFQRCASLQNFSTPRSILAALDSSTIARLNQTWSVRTIDDGICAIPVLILFRLRVSRRSIACNSNLSGSWQTMPATTTNTAPVSATQLRLPSLSLVGDIYDVFDYIRLTMIKRPLPHRYHVLPRRQPVATHITQESREETPKFQQISQNGTNCTRFVLVHLARFDFRI